jgi:iron(III) transport system substrate-binding protein
MKRIAFIRHVSSVLALTSSYFALPVLASGTPSAKEINVYSSRHYEVDKEINEAFTKATGIKVKVVSVKEAAQLMERMKAEGKRSPADVLMTVDVGNLYAAKKADLFQKLSLPEAQAKVPAHLRDGDDLWVGLTFRARVIAYQKDKVKPEEVATYESLSDPKWKNRLLVRSSNHVYNQSLTASLVQAQGEAKAEDWAKGITANLARKPEGGDTDQIKAIAAGRGDLAIVNSYYAARLLASEKSEDKKLMEKIGLSFPNQSDRGTHINVSGMGIAKHAPQPEAARQYVAFWLGEQAQTLLAQQNFEYPVVKGVEPTEQVKKLGTPKFDDVPLTKVAEQTPVAIRVLDRAGWR